MVKAKISTKAKAKSRIDQCASVCRISRTGTSSNKKFENVPMCCECGTIIDEDTKALQCERCVVNETWKCAACLDFSDELYDQLVCSSKNNLHWFCEKCEVIAMDVGAPGGDKISPLIEKLHAKNDDIAQHIIDTLAKFEQNVLDRVGAVESMLQRKAENVMLQSIESRLQKIEDRPVVIEEIQQRLEDKVDQLKRNMDEPVVQAVQEALQGDKAEEAEIEHRKTNVIVHGVSESDAEDADQRIDNDMIVLATMFQEVKVENVTLDSVVRLGKRATDPAQNPRPMKVVLDSVESKVSLLKKTKNLREKEEGGWSKVFIHQDLTPKQREARKPLVAELKQRKANGETDLIIFNGKVLKKRFK